ncbi:AAA ATPase central domain protein [Methylorubrum extorquens DSM 13060]|uniref:AAA ATPase central domain protein n=1 Tax=Methylorubrum extorquens DSM 13060 TaxID=882800 RepID=H1KG39_METEX|nr:AAA family ATPase [Methylorubrum extorquens]EHP93471.1 AAA ATPase central domain protein [Methylorubrum extorquens DSM 13060]
MHPRDLNSHGRSRGAFKAWGLGLIEDLCRGRAGEIPSQRARASFPLGGPPGCGKTYFGMALARTSGLPFPGRLPGAVAGARDGHLGHTLAAMRQIFRVGREPCVALIGEFGSIGDRETFASRRRDYSGQVVNALQELLDGAVSREGMVVMGRRTPRTASPRTSVAPASWTGTSASACRVWMT